MTKKNIDEVMRLTQECLTRYWQLDIDYIISLCDEDVVWIGALQSEFTMGKDAFIEDLTAVKKELKPVILFHRSMWWHRMQGLPVPLPEDIW